MSGLTLAAPTLALPAERRLSAQGWVVPAVLLVLGTITTYLRVPASGRDTLYAEDGRVFLGDWVNHPSWGLIAEPYQGYEHLLPRAVAGLVAAVVPVDRWAAAMTLAACLMVGAVAALVFVASRDVVSSAGARLGFALIPVLVPLAGLEPVGNMANVHWYLLYLTPWLLLALPQTTRAAVGFGVVAFVAAMTELQAALFAPLALLVLIRRPRARWVVAGWAAGMAVQTLSYLLTDRARGDGSVSFESAAQGYAINAVLSNTNRDNDAVGRFLLAHGWWPAVAALAAMAALAVAAVIVGGWQVRIAVAALLAGSVLSWFGTFYVNNAPLYDYSAYTGGLIRQVPYVRWGMGAAMFLLALIPLAAGAAAARWPRLRLLPFAATGVLVAVMLLSFTSPDNPRQLDGPGRDWSSAVNAARDACVDGTVDLPTQPPGWVLKIPCDRLR